MSAPLNAAFILEEARRESWDENTPFIIIMLDAKSAFNVVHKNMLRKLYHINSMHTHAKTSIKWKVYISESFNIEQGVSQGGILSDYLYKSYVDPLLHRLKDSGLGLKIGDVCADTSA